MPVTPGWCTDNLRDFNHQSSGYETNTLLSNAMTTERVFHSRRKVMFYTYAAHFQQFKYELVSLTMIWIFVF